MIVRFVKAKKNLSFGFGIAWEILWKRKTKKWIQQWTFH